MKSGPQEVSDVQSSAAGWLVKFDMMRLSVIQTGRTRGLRFPGKLSNFDTYDPNANYSSVLFQQYLASPQTKKTLPGMYGDRVLNLYGGPDCRDLDPKKTYSETGTASAAGASLRARVVRFHTSS